MIQIWFKIIVLIFFVNSATLLYSQAIPDGHDDFADQNFIDNSDMYVEQHGVQMTSRPRSDRGYAQQREIEVDIQDIKTEDDVQTESGSNQSRIRLRNSSSSKIGKRRSFGMSFSDMAKATKKERASSSNRLTFSFGDLADLTKKDKTSTRNNRIKLPSKK